MTQNYILDSCKHVLFSIQPFLYLGVKTLFPLPRWSNCFMGSPLQQAPEQPWGLGGWDTSTGTTIAHVTSLATSPPVPCHSHQKGGCLLHAPTTTGPLRPLTSRPPYFPSPFQKPTMLGPASGTSYTLFHVPHMLFPPGPLSSSTTHPNIASTESLSTTMLSPPRNLSSHLVHFLQESHLKSI